MGRLYLYRLDYKTRKTIKIIVFYNKIYCMITNRLFKYTITIMLLGMCSKSLAYFSDGTFDTSFGIGLGTNWPVYTISQESNWLYLLWWAFDRFNGIVANRIVRLQSNWLIDSSFSPVSGANNIIRTTQKQWDGKYIIWGNFTGYDGVTRNRIARLNSDGTLDTTFNPGSWFNTTVINSFLQSDGKIIAMGSFTNFSGTTRNRIARLNSDGSLDTTFNPGTLSNATIYTLVQQPDTKYIVGGAFTTFNGIARTRVARITTTWALDTTFGTNTWANNYISSMVLQPDGRIIVAGLFTWYSWLSINRIARLSSWWLLDTTFNSGWIWANDLIWSVRLQSDGKIIIGGLFTSYNGIPVSGIARLNSDGTLDTTFNLNGLWTNSDVYRNWMTLQTDGKIVIWGNFSWYNGIWVWYMARLWYATTWFIIAPTKLSSGAIIDTTLIVTWSSTIYATGITIDPSSTITGSIICNQTNSLQVDCTVTITSSGNLVIRWTDANGTWILFTENDYIIDTNPPTINIIDDVSTAINTGDIISIIVWDDLQLQTGTLLYGYSNDAVCDSGDSYVNSYQSWSSIIFIDESHNGEYICFQAIDHVGNVSYQWTAFPLLIDITPPVLTIITGSNIVENATYIMLFTGSDNITWSIIYECKIDTWVWNVCTSPYTISWLWYGTHTASIRASDIAGNISSVVSVSISYPEPVKSQGWGWWNSITKDNCPKWDYTSSYYDNACGTPPVIDVWDDDTSVDEWSSDTTITYTPTQVYNASIANGKCYQRKSDVSIINSKTIQTTQEFKKALSFLYVYDMTVFNAIAEFDPYRTLTREEAAKIFSNFAMNVLCRKPDESLTIQYGDVENSDLTLKPYITLAYQLWLMKWDENRLFRSKDDITKAELNAVLVRMILKSYLPENTSDSWYTEYNAVSSELGIIKYGADLTSLSRNNAALMLFRAYKEQKFSLQYIDYESFVLDTRDEYIK